MRNRIALGATLAAALLACGSLSAAGDVESGPAVGSKGLAAFHPLHATGRAAGKRVCLV